MEQKIAATILYHTETASSRRVNMTLGTILRDDQPLLRKQISIITSPFSPAIMFTEDFYHPSMIWVSTVVPGRHIPGLNLFWGKCLGKCETQFGGVGDFDSYVRVGMPYGTYG